MKTVARFRSAKKSQKPVFSHPHLSMNQVAAKHVFRKRSPAFLVKESHFLQIIPVSGRFSTQVANSIPFHRLSATKVMRQTLPQRQTSSSTMELARGTAAVGSYPKATRHLNGLAH